MKKKILLVAAWAAAAGISAQEISTKEKVSLTLSADLVNQYIWRGQDLGSVALQPSFGVAYKGLSLTAWGSYALTDAADTKEFDLTLGYTAGGLSIGITDYWFSDGLDPRGRYFKYDAHGTNHVLEATVGYDFGPVALVWNTNFAGNDGINADGDRAYSSYFEVSAPFQLAGADWTAAAGAVPYATTAYGTTGFAVTNLALKASIDIKVTDSFSIPVFGQVAANPCAQKAYLVFGFTLQP
ncbi:MAG: hypothetical protein IJ544_02555 [Prevotella sp.]|nr:hypothetical protein [Prevotella sp.]